jgi:hypothetical protein
LSTVWTFVRCGIDGKSDGVYDKDYETAIAANIDEVSEGKHRAEFVHDIDMPGALRYRGSWGMLALYNPDLDIGNKDGNIYFAGIDTIFLRDMDRLVETMRDIDKDIVGNRCPSEGTFNTMVGKIRRGSPGALHVWNHCLKLNFDFPPRPTEHKIVRELAKDYIGLIPDGLVESYKLHIGAFFSREVQRQKNLDNVCALAFHGKRKQKDLCEWKEAPLRDLVIENWGRHIGLG